MSVKPPVPVLLTRRQAWLIVEQMEKGAAAWDDSWATNCAAQIAKKIRGMIALIDGKEKPVNIKLKPCAHCGSKARNPVLDYENNVWVVSCSHCGSRMWGYEIPADAEDAWNRREAKTTFHVTETEENIQP